MADLPHSRRPISVSTPDNVALIERMVMEDRFLTVDQLCIVWRCHREQFIQY